MTGGWDAHTHLVPEGVLGAAGTEQWDMGLGEGRLAIAGHAMPLGRIAEPAQLLARLDSDGLAGGIVSIPPPLFRPDLADAGARAAYAGFVNEALLETCRAAPDRLRPLAYLPLEEPALAARLAADLGHEWAGVVGGSDLCGFSYADAALEDLWDVLEAAGYRSLSTPRRRTTRALMRSIWGTSLATPSRRRSSPRNW